jgi:opacity protein-like surface antigen
MRRATTTATLLTASALLLLAAPANAQESTTRGFTIGVHLSGASLQVESQDRNNAGGGGLRLGYGVNRRITIFVQGDGARFDEQSTGAIDGDWTMAHFDLGARLNFANSLRSWVPFLEGALGYRAVSVSNPIVEGTPRNELRLEGAGLTFGGGLAFYFAESFALDLALLWTGGEFRTVRVDNVSVGGFDFDANSSRLNLGVAWWF